MDATKLAESESSSVAEIQGSGDPSQAPEAQRASPEVKSDANRSAFSVALGNIMALPKRRGGPISALGKEKSRRNAVKHGIFAKVVVLSNEPLSQFDDLLQGFRNALRPVGAVEEVLVEKLATLVWRYRRVLVTERAEIRIEQRDGSQKSERERQQREEIFAMASSGVVSSRGLMGNYENPVGMEQGLKFLEMLRTSIGVRGFVHEEDTRLLLRVFGTVEGHRQVLLYCLYYSPTNRVHQEEFKEFDLPRKEREAKYVDYLKVMIREMRKISRLCEVESKILGRMETVTANIPEAPRLDRILRYSASLERDFDRTLGQLERLQRMRKGQPAPPTLNVNIAG